MPTSLAVVDSHALIWFASGQRRLLGPDARAIMDRAAAGRAALYVPTTVLIEVGEAMRKGRVRGPGFDKWLDGLLATGRYIPVDLTVPIVRRVQGLYAIPERGDRIIAATAAELEAPLITRDPAIAAAAGVELLW